MRVIRLGDGLESLWELKARGQADAAKAQEVVDRIVSEVRAEGDIALLRYTKKFDSELLEAGSLRATEAEIEEAVKEAGPELLAILKRAFDRILAFHEKQKEKSWIDIKESGAIMGQIVRPLESVGIYVPGGTAAYPSTALMNMAPARVAGVKRIVMVTPASKDGKARPAALAAAKVAGVSEIYKIGGAQAVAALACGTASIPKVDKITGPGNIYVSLAKKSLYGVVDIDSVAGPSEILALADGSANPEHVAADLLSQAEHDALAQSILVTTSEKLAEEVLAEIQIQAQKLERKDIIERSLRDYGAIVIAKTMEQAVEAANFIAPEHMEVITENPWGILPGIKNAGAIFLGGYTPEALGDYMAGPNHVLPTSGTARFFSPLSVSDFCKKSSLICFSREAFLPLREDIIAFAQAEGFGAHANSARVRS
jgi:histidinol dehydrogenase